jgi:hypothetical protein
MPHQGEGESEARAGGNGAAQKGLSRRLRIDDRRGLAATDELGATHSGRRFVLALVFVLGSFALALFVAFRQWSTRQEELAAYGANRVAAALAPLAEKVPPRLDAAEWARIVDQGRRMLVGLTASGTMNLDQMRRLRAEIQETILAARPETAAGTLASLWSDLERRAGPGLTRSPRFELAGAVRGLSGIVPAGLERERWMLAIVQTRAMLTALLEKDPMPATERRRLREAIEAIASRSKPETAAADLESVWELVADSRAIPEGYHKPALGPAPREGVAPSGSGLP